MATKNTSKENLRLPSLAFIIWPAISLGLAGIGLAKSPFAGAMGAAAGLLWGFLITWTARRIAQNARWHQKIADLSLFLAIITSGILLGGGLVYQLLVTAAVAHPETLPTILQPAIGGVLNIVFISCNSMMEYILIPLVVLLNWNSPRRRMVLAIAAVIYYLSRIWTYAYFAVDIIDLTNSVQPGVPFTAGMVARFQTWVNLDWGRNVFDLVVGLLFASASFKPFASTKLVNRSSKS